MLTHMLILEMGPHGYLSLETPIAYGTMIRQRLCVCSKMFRQMIFAKESKAETEKTGISLQSPHTSEWQTSLTFFGTPDTRKA